MTEFVLGTAEPKTMLSHMALYGLAAIVEDGGLDDVRLSWTGSMTPQPVLHAPRATPETVGEIVRAHAARRAVPESWPNRPVHEGEKGALMSPRISSITTGDGWRSLQRRRHDVLDELTDSRSFLDLRLIAALGEPSYWNFNRKGQRLQDNGASRLEMQPRNTGSEFVRTRIRPLAKAVAARTVSAVSDGLLGNTVRDESEKDKFDSRTPAGFASPGPTDNALAWCALWGISQFPIAQRIHTAGARDGWADTTGHTGSRGSGHFYTPVWQGLWRTARLRSIVASGQLRRFVGIGLNPKEAEPQKDAARQWLASRGVTSVVRFTVERHGSDSAPERRAGLGELLKTGRC